MIISNNKKTFTQTEIHFERNELLRGIRDSKSISVTEKILMILVLVGLAFMIVSAATMYFQNCWVVSSIPFYYGSVQFALTFGVFLYNLKLSRVELWSQKMIGVTNLLSATINLIMYYVQFQDNVLCNNAICHANFTGRSIIENMTPEERSCSTFVNNNSLQTSNAIFVQATKSLLQICLNQEQCNPELNELYVFNQSGYFVGLMIVTFVLVLNGAQQLFRAFKTDQMKAKLEKYQNFTLQMFEGDDIE